MKISKQWKKLLTRNGADIDIINQRKVQRSLSFICLLKHDRTIEKAKFILADVMRQEVNCIGMINRFLCTSKRIQFLQQRVLFRVETREAKIEIVAMQWQKLVYTLMRSATAQKDIETMNILNKIIKIPKKIQKAALEKWIRRC